MHLSPRQRTAVELIADTFAPGRGVVPSATELGSVDLSLEFLARNPRASELRILKALFSLWDSRFAALMLTGRLRRFSAVGHEMRESMLKALAQSRFGQNRMLFTILRSAFLAPYYMESDAAGRSPVLEAVVGFRPVTGEPSSVNVGEPLAPLMICSDENLDCDVVVVGSGAGGGTAASVLSAAGLDVIIVEAGGYHGEDSFDGTEKTGLRNLYAPAPLLSREGQVSLWAGHCVGGGTVVNYTTCFPTPERVRQEWASSGAHQFAGTEYTEALNAVWQRLDVNRNHDVAAPRDAVMERGLRNLGWTVGATFRNVDGCDMGIRCGRCGMGCSLGAKRSTTKTWLADAVSAGARLIADTSVRTIETTGGKASGVTAVATGGHRVIVRARAVVVAAGAIQTPALLQRSGLGNRNVGRHLRLHPATVVWGRNRDSAPPWEGSLQSRYSDQHADLDGNGYGVIYETVPITPGIGAVLLPWHGGRAHLTDMKDIHALTPLAVITRDKGAGEVTIGRDGEPIVRYRLSGPDTAHLMAGIEGAAQILEAAGADKIIGPHQKGISYEPGKDGSVESFAAATRAAGAAPGVLPVLSLHLMGSARMGDDPRRSATNPDGEVWGAPGVIVADASCFPTASGVNPMISIQAIAYMNATRLAARLR